MKKFLSVLIVSFILSTTSLFAQEVQPIANEKKMIDIAFVTNEIQKIEKSINIKTPTKEESVLLIKNLSTYYSDLQTKKTFENENLETIQKKLSSLGEVQEGEKELKEITKQRESFLKEIESVKGQIAKTDLALTQIDTLNQKIASLRSQGLKETLIVKRESILDGKKLVSDLVNFSLFLYNLLKYPIQWYTEQSIDVQSDILKKLFSLLSWAIFTLILAIFINIFVRKKLGYSQPIEKPSYTQKVQAGIFMIVARAIIPAAIPLSFLLWRYQHPDFLTGHFGTLVDIFAHYLIYLFLFTGLTSVLFTPKKPQWRLIEISDEKAKKVSKTLVFSLYILCFFSFIHVAAQQLSTDTETIYAIKMLNNFIKGIAIIVVSLNVLYNNKTLTDEELDNEKEITGLSLSSKIGILIALFSTCVLTLSMYGYVKLGEFIYNRFILSLVFIVAGYIFQKFIFVLFHQLMNKKFWGKNLRITKQKVKRIELLFNVITIPIVLFFISLAILGIWGVSIDILLQNAKKYFVGFEIGGMHVSISSICSGILAFVITHYIFKTIKISLCEGKLSEIFDLEIGVRTSVAALIGFAGSIISILVGLSVMGGSLKGLAIAAGALSLGAGLGLQNVVNNFVSGIILLFERPFKIGDWIVVDQFEGTVKQINMRSTQIETFNKSNVIIPNATLLSTSLINMTYKNKLARVDLLVGVDYDSDIELVKETLLECAKETKNILQVPSPYVAFMELADNSLNFRLSFYVSDVTNKLSIQTAVYTSIVEKFRARNINIPFPQRVLHVKNETTQDVSTLISD